ncbi:hypothetical protein [Perlabentimonas gracilis]|uniref:hypothetical protein n=1 Tax=Perlabentimonas gracilis TaxID=2715279 RepID=UPI00140DA85B|nr:hypothetical protein [Perlabentimonas gracilis]NHB69371.1 hypothetical protein [Perlabentimonas gracilis]
MKRIVNLMLVTLAFSSCVPLYYMPNNANIPLLKEEGETVAQAHYGATDDMNFFGLNAAHAIGKNTALMFNTSAFITDHKPEEVSSPIEIENNRNYNSSVRAFMAEAGVGFFIPVSKDSVFVFETYAGYGLYSANRALNSNQSITYNIHRPFIQPSIGIRYKRVELSYGLRLSKLFFANSRPSTAFEIDEIAMSGYDVWDKAFRLEHSFTLGIGNDRIKAQIQWINTPFFNILSETATGIEGNSNISMGIRYRF